MPNTTSPLSACTVSESQKCNNKSLPFDLEERCKTIISIIGEKKAEELYHHFSSEKISFAVIHRYLKNKEIKNQLGGERTIKSIAKHYNVSRMTIYRLIHEKLGI